jgi:hypothetical protein
MGELVKDEELVKDFETTREKSFWQEILLPAVVILVIITVGGVTGYFLAERGSGASGEAKLVQSAIETGIKDDRVFRDSAVGKIVVNEKEDEGSHLLLRPGGPSQTAHLTSSVVDLNNFVGKCVQVWGETQSAQKAGWLMDVGRVKILDRCPEGI